MTLFSNSLAITMRMWRDLLSPFRLPLIIAMLAMIMTAGANALQAWLIQPAIDDGLTGGNLALLPFLCLIIVAVGFFKGFTDYWQNRLLGYVGSSLIANLQASMIDKAIYTDLQSLHEEGSARLLTKFLSDSQLVRDASIRSLIGIIKDGLTVIGMIGVMLYQSWTLSLWVLIVFPLSVWPVVALGAKLRKISKITQANLGDITTQLDSFFKSLRIVKSYGAETSAKEQMTELFQEQAKLQARAVEIRGRTSPILETLGSAAVALLILIGSYRIAHGTSSQGEIMSFLTALLMAYQPLKSLAGLHAIWQLGLAAAERCFVVIDQDIKISSPTPCQPMPSDMSLEFVGVSFRYGAVDNHKIATPPSASPTLDNICLSIPQGSWTALVGPSGSGKSTIINLLLRLVDPHAGHIRLGGIDIRQLNLTSLRQQFALVAQEPGLINATIAENIGLSDSAAGRPLDIQRVIEAAKAAEAHEFIHDLPDQYQTLVVEMGAKFSGGQRQRLAIARALYRDAPILLLDEATSALDSETEAAIQRALARLRQGRTSITIAHRLATIQDADQIIVLEDGRVVEQGTHQELIQANRLYSQLSQLQFR